MELRTPYYVNQVWTTKDGTEIASIHDKDDFFCFDVFNYDAHEILRRINVATKINEANADAIESLAYTKDLKFTKSQKETLLMIARKLREK